MPFHRLMRQSQTLSRQKEETRHHFVNLIVNVIEFQERLKFP